MTSKKNLNINNNSSRETLGLNAEKKPLTRRASEWHPKVFIKTFGCQMNEYDSELIRGLFEQAGYALAKSEAGADVIIFNTCSVRERAEARVWGQVTALKASNQKPVARNRKKIIAEDKKEKTSISNPRSPIIAVAGCMAQNYQDKIFKKLPNVNIVCGTGDIYDLPKLVEKAAQKKDSRILAVAGTQHPHFIGSAGVRKGRLKAFVTITEGCDNYCSYCIVPYVRGAQVSRRPEGIMDEVKSLVDEGTKEITLLGQNVNSYGLDLHNGRMNFVKLLEVVSKIKGLERVRFTTSHPKDTTVELFKLIAGNKKVCPHLHLPLQSGSDKILKIMNRKYTTSHYLKLVNLYRKFVKDTSLTTDIIVGFPGETEDDFNATLNMMREIAFDGAFIFKYSPRPPAASSGMPDDVEMEVKKERNQILLDLQRKISLNKNRLYLGREVEVLVEGYDKSKKKLLGKTPKNKTAVFLAKKDFIDKIVKVKVEDVTESTLICSIV